MPKLSKEIFKAVLFPIHKHFWNKAYKKLSAKMSALKGSLRKRSEESDVLFDITSTEIREMFLESYGKECKYCTKILTYKTIACDHIEPLSKKGKSIKTNLQLICKTCNTRKGPLDEKDFELLIELVLRLPQELSEYVMRKLAKGGRY